MNDLPAGQHEIGSLASEERKSINRENRSVPLFAEQIICNKPEMIQLIAWAVGETPGPCDFDVPSPAQQGPIIARPE